MSRLKPNPERIFECFAEVTAPSIENGSSVEPHVIKVIPDDYESDSLKALPKFCFPCEPEHAKPTPDAQKFTFVLTDIEGKLQFGYCRMKPDYSVCLCFLSYLPWTELYYGLLDKIGSFRNSGQDLMEDPLLHAVFERHLPSPGEVLYIVPKGVVSGQTYQVLCPNTRKLPSIPENWNLTEYYSSVSAHNILVIFASMLFERRILITSQRLSLITACTQGACLLLYPLHWQHIYIPIMPSHLKDYCCAPMPFLIGIHSSLMDRVRKMPLDDIVILDVDANTVEKPEHFDDVEQLPPRVVTSLKHVLKKHTSGVDDLIPKAFLVAFGSMIGNYRDFFQRKEKDGKVKIVFDEDGFIESQDRRSKPFIEQLMHFQHFQQFVSERLAVLNEGQGITDLFERAPRNIAKKTAATRLKAVKHHTKKKVKAVLPGVKNLMRQAKKKAKSGIKVIRKLAETADAHEKIEGESESDSDTSVDGKRASSPSKQDADRSISSSSLKRAPPPLPAPYAVYRELKDSTEGRRPRSRPVASTPSRRSAVDLLDDLEASELAKAGRDESLISFSPEASPEAARRPLSVMSPLIDTGKAHIDFLESLMETLPDVGLETDSDDSELVSTASSNSEDYVPADFKPDLPPRPADIIAMTPEKSTAAHALVPASSEAVDSTANTLLGLSLALSREQSDSSAIVNPFASSLDSAAFTQPLFNPTPGNLMDTGTPTGGSASSPFGAQASLFSDADVNVGKSTDLLSSSLDMFDPLKQ